MELKQLGTSEVKHLVLFSSQVHYSMVNRDIEKEIVPQALREKMSIIPYSPLATISL